ncbi:probable receptor-like protein kinase At5g59700 isoform X1 [Lactuca sativa]|uniref:probable receptor-like protein kinase At5g59700 isoform X1 n=1 Tax=Lactuca sativa TaxID=4236 RepID=UPI000CD8D4E2|nr:probable receptor-like protein kinase At5g59700 isoform X1 [Lactuca sativa]
MVILNHTKQRSSSSSPIHGHKYKYDVFLSFCSRDTGRSFTDHLCNAIKHANITTFFDDDLIERGVYLKPGWESAIKASRASVVVLSKNYGHSQWCLNGLALILEQHSIVIPIFYHVEPSFFEDAMAGYRLVMEAMTNEDKRSRLAEKIDRWNKACTQVATLKGMQLGFDRRETEFIQDFVKYIYHRLRISARTPLPLDRRFHREMKQPNLFKIPFQAIKTCTQNFSERNFIAKGGYGRVYKGIFTWENHVNQLVAVKRLDVTNGQGNKEFHTELTMLSQYQHDNIVTLIGFCDDNKEMILVYEYVSHGSLDTHLRNPSAGLSWPQLLKICIDIASALDYLHNHVAEKHRIIHRDIKSANILLDENWNAKLADFGLARIGLANQQNTYVITNLAGTHGYCDPQYEKTGLLTKESDVYSFGVVLFEVLCGRLACALNYHDEQRFLHHLAPTCYKNKELDKIIDPRIRKDIKPRVLRKFSAIAYRCLHETREERPTIADVVFQLKKAMKMQIGSSRMC